MDFKNLYVSLDGRISRKQFWLGVVILLIASLVVSFAVQGLLGVQMMGTGFPDAQSAWAAAQLACWINLAIFLIILWPAAALMLKRRHDRGRSGAEVWVYLALGIAVQLMPALGIGYAAITDPATGRYMIMPGIAANIIGIGFGLFALYMLVVLGFLKGDAGANAYGPDPLGNG